MRLVSSVMLPSRRSGWRKTHQQKNFYETFSNLCKKKEVKDYHLESRQVAFWSDHSDGTRAQSEDGRCLVSSPWTITLVSVNTRWTTEEEKQSCFGYNFAKECGSSRASPRKLYCSGGWYERSSKNQR